MAEEVAKIDTSDGLIGVVVKRGTVEKLRYQYEALGIIQISFTKKELLLVYPESPSGFAWKLTNLGRKYISSRRAVKRAQKKLANRPISSLRGSAD
jgi:hypothetical protein